MGILAVVLVGGVATLLWVRGGGRDEGSGALDIPTTREDASAAPSAAATTETRPHNEAAAPVTPPPVPEPPAGMVAIPGGTYPVGCQADDRACREDERPGRNERVAAFALDVFEVAMEDYDECVAVEKCAPAGKGRGCTWQMEGMERFPINCVDHAAASAYCRWKGRRLPTEIEWEIAARGPRHPEYPWGDESPTCERTVMSSAQGPGCGTGRLMAVGSRPGDRSWVGALDLGGNVREWVSNVYAAYPGGRVMEGVEGRVNRGGSYGMAAEHMATARTRNADADPERQPDLGFRCAVSLE